ncbi:TPA: hypothetical protein ACH3X1_005264 [Trebouxia sp. C0004]
MTAANKEREQLWSWICCHNKPLVSQDGLGAYHKSYVYQSTATEVNTETQSSPAGSICVFLYEFEGCKSSCSVGCRCNDRAVQAQVVIIV